MNILFLDIETSPLVTFQWRPDDSYTTYDKLIETSYMIGWAAKWRAKKKIMSDIQTPAEAGANNDDRLVDNLAALVREADYVVAHNAKKFDVPRINSRVALLGQENLPPVQIIDTLELARKSFSLPYYKLDHLAEQFLGEKKIETDMDLWRRCYHGNAEALAYMHKYNRKDVVILERLFERMLPYLKGVPRLIDPNRNRDLVCPFCGTANVEKRGKRRTGVSTFQRFRCLECGLYSKVWTGADQPRAGLTPIT